MSRRMRRRRGKDLKGKVLIVVMMTVMVAKKKKLKAVLMEE